MQKFSSAAVAAMVVAFGMFGQANAADLQPGESITSATHDWYISIAAFALQRSSPNA